MVIRYFGKNVGSILASTIELDSLVEAALPPTWMYNALIGN